MPACWAIFRGSFCRWSRAYVSLPETTRWTYCRTARASFHVPDLSLLVWCRNGRSHHQELDCLACWNTKRASYGSAVTIRLLAESPKTVADGIGCDRVFEWWLGDRLSYASSRFSLLYRSDSLRLECADRRVTACALRKASF